MKKLSTSQKWEFLGALYKYGCKAEHLKNLEDWNEDLIKEAVKSYRGRALRSLQTSQRNNEEAIDMWYDLIHNCHEIEGTSDSPKQQSSEVDWKSYSFLLSKSLQYAATFEEHYQGRNPDEPNYNEIYRYLGQLVAGEEPTQLRPGNAQKLIDMMSKMKDLLNNKEDIQCYLNYIANQHSVSYLKPGVDVWSVVEEKKRKAPEETTLEESQLFEDASAEAEEERGASLSGLDPRDPQFAVKKEKMILKLSLKQRALARTLDKVPGMNPLEVASCSLVKPHGALAHASLRPNANPSNKKFKCEKK